MSPPADFRFPTGVEGYGNEAMGRRLYELACTVPEDEWLVELGTYRGQSAVCLAQSGRKLLTIDHFTGETDVNPRAAHWAHITGRYGPDEVVANVDRYAPGHNDLLVRTGKTWEPPTEIFPVGMLFIDGAHDYDSVRRDFTAWEPLLGPGSIVVFDDYGWPGVTALVDSLMKDPVWATTAIEGRLAVLKRKS